MQRDYNLFVSIASPLRWFRCCCAKKHQMQSGGYRGNLTVPVRVTVVFKGTQLNLTQGTGNKNTSSFSSAKPGFLHLSEPDCSLLCSSFLSYIQPAPTTALQLSLIGNQRLLMLPRFQQEQREDDRRDLMIRSHPSNCSYRCRQSCVANLLTATLASLAEDQPQVKLMMEKSLPRRDRDQLRAWAVLLLIQAV